MDISDVCDFCEDQNCIMCDLGNPCLRCDDYDRANDICTSKGACGGEL